MKLQDIVDTIGNIKGMNLIIHTTMDVHPKFKIYKIFKYTLYQRVDEQNKQVLYAQFTVSASSADNSNILQTWEKLDKEFIDQLLRWAIYGDKNE